MAVLGMMSLMKRDICRNILLALLAMLGVGASVAMFDPVSMYFFNHTDVGDSIIVSTGNNIFGDAAIYNMQMSWIEKPISDACYDSYSEELPVVLPVKNNSVYCFDGMSRQIGLEKGDDIGLIDIEGKRRVAYADQIVGLGSVKESKIYYIGENETLEKLDDMVKEFNLIYMKNVNDVDIPQGFEVVETQKYVYRGFEIYRDKVKRK